MPLLGLSLWLTARAEKRKGSLSAFLVCGLSWALRPKLELSGWRLGLFVSFHPRSWSTRKWLRLIPALVIIFALAIPQARRSQEVLGFSAPFGLYWTKRVGIYLGRKGYEAYFGREWSGRIFEYSNPVSCISIRFSRSSPGIALELVRKKHGSI